MKPKAKVKATPRGPQAAGKAPTSHALRPGGVQAPSTTTNATTATATASVDYAHLVRSWAASLPLGQQPTAYYLADLVARLEGVGPMDRPMDRPSELEEGPR